MSKEVAEIFENDEEANISLAIENYEQAAELFEKAYEARDSHLIYINQGPRFDPLREDPRFISLMGRIDWL